MTVKMSTKGWVVIPAALRKKYNLEPGADLLVIDYGGVITLVPTSENPIEDGAGMLKGEISLTQMLLEEHRKEIKNEH